MRLSRSLFSIIRFNRKNWKTVVLCVFTATVFWFFNALNKTYTTNIQFPLTFDFDRANYVPVKPLPKEVLINVTGNGWDLFKRSTGIKVPALEIPLKRPAEVKKIVSSDNLSGFFSTQLEGLEINFVLTDTLYVDLEPKAGRWITVVLDSVEANIRPGFGLASNIAVMPDSIFVEGPQRLVVKLEEPVVIRLPQREIDEYFMEDVEVKFPNPELIQRDPPTVAVMFSVEKMITIRDSIPVEVRNIPASVSSVMNAAPVPVTYSIPSNRMEGFRQDSVKAVLDLKNFIKGEAKFLPQVKGLPEFSKVVKIDSVRVIL